MKALVVVCLVLCSGAALAQGRKQPEQNPSWIGRWYSGSDGSECKGKGYQTQGLWVYTAKELRGMETRCRIESTKPKGNAVEMLLRCRGEGETWTERETVSVSGNKLQRQSMVDGKPVSSTHTRCP